MKKIISVIFAAVMMAVMCTVSVSAAGVKLNKTSVSVPIGYRTALTVSGASEKVEWSVKDSKIASVQSTGDASAKVVGKGTGTTYVYASANGKTLKCKVTVKKSFISLSSTETSLEEGGSASVTVKAVGSKTLQCANSDSSICSVSFGSWNGDRIKLNIKAKKEGTAKITLYAKGYSKTTAKTITVNVKSDKKDPEALAAEVVEIVNSERKSSGKGSLTADSELTRLANIRAEEIVSYFSHTRPDGRSCFTVYDDNGYSYSAIAENIAMSIADSEKIMDMWMNSSGHKKNIMNGTYTKIGVGVCIVGDYAYWVQLFAA
ncbi:MAG: CAP domain-containing protein [Oscillospiraceae bacterium]|nr:CAP domain-containing protein [Oscillospiraceae bacterium]